MRATPGQRLTPELEDLRYRTLAAAYRVHTALGPALKEDIYRKCFVHALRNDGFEVEVDRPLDIEFEGLHLKKILKPDVIVNDTIIYELKAALHPHPVWEAQIISYLYRTGLPLGYLVNFKVPRLRDGLQRYVNTMTAPASAISPERTE